MPPVTSQLNIPVVTPLTPTEVEVRGRRLLYFGGSDYFRLSWHPKIRSAVCRFLTEHGLNVGSSRTVTGNHPLYLELERGISRFFGFPAATLTSLGYGAPLIAAQALAGQVTHALVDDRAHGCLKDAAALLRVHILTFRHEDASDLARAARKCGRKSRIVVLTDGMSAHEGTVAPLREYLDVMPKSAFLLVDDAHGTGTVGQRGRGSLEYLGVSDPRIILAVTLSKALGCYGGAVLGPRWLRDRIVSGSSLYSSSAPLPLPLAAAALASLRLMTEGGTNFRRRLSQKVSFVKQAFLHSRPDWQNAPGPMFSLAPDKLHRQEMLRRKLLRAGIYPTFIRYSAGPADRFFRFSISLAHSQAELTRLRNVLAEFESTSV